MVWLMVLGVRCSFVVVFEKFNSCVVVLKLGRVVRGGRGEIWLGMGW